MSVLGIIGFAVALVIFILIHEAAHMVAAKRCGMKVEEYFVGFGPKLWSFKRGETEYGLKAIVAGGYVKIAGMNPFVESPPEDYPRTFGAKPIWQRAATILAGPLTHFFLAAILFAIGTSITGVTSPVGPKITQVAQTIAGVESPAKAAGMLPGDRIVGVGDISNPSSQQLQTYTKAHIGQPVQLRLLRNGQTVTVTATPVRSTFNGQVIGRFGLLLDDRAPAGLFPSIKQGVAMTGQMTVQVITKLGSVFNVGRIGKLLFTQAQRSPQDPASVVGVGRVVGQATQQHDYGFIFFLLGFVNIFLGVINLLPLPPFDGGHLMVLAIEKIRGKKVDMRKMIPVGATVMAFVVFYMGALIVLDFVKPLPNVLP